MDINTKKLKKNAFRVTKHRGITASRIRVPGGHLNAKYLGLIQEIAEKYASQVGTLKKPVNMLFTAECGKPMKLELEACNTKVSVFGASAEIAGKQPATVESCIKNLSKLGNTDFTAGKITADIGTNVFVPVSILNDLRRNNS